MVTDTTTFMGVSSDSSVVTATGMRKLSRVRVGDEVLTKSGEYERVTEVVSTGEQEQTVYKVTIPLVDEPFESTLYLSENCVVYGLPNRSDMATEIAVSELSSDSYVFLPEKVQYQAPILRHQLRGNTVVTDDSGAYVPVGRVVKTTLRTSLVSLKTESGSFIVGGVTIQR